MLWNLYIENIAVAKQLDIQFNDGFTVMTGQTGAGKSIIIDSLLLLCGAKNGRELIRTGEDKALVSAIFQVSDSEGKRLDLLGYPPDENGEIQITRQLSSDGRSVAKIGKRSVPLNVLKEAAQVLLSIQTQTERNAYAEKSTYVSLLDLFADSDKELSEYSEDYSELVEVKRKIEELKTAMNEREMMLDILKYQKKEIDSAKLNADDEEERLIRLRTKLKSAERVSKYAGVVTKALLYSEKGATVVYLLERAEAALSQLSDVVESADEMAARLANLRYEAVDIAEQIRDQFDEEELENPHEKLTQIESRLSLIEKLRKKYGATIPEIKAKRNEISAKITDLEEGDIKMSELERELERIKIKASASASKLSEKRVSAARRLSDEIASSLKFLDMPKVRFQISVVPLREKTGELIFKADGADDVDFLISVNVGEEMQSLGKVSSGGELSRITLAIKTALAEKYASGTLVFDEIDAGVSGGTSERIGMMLCKLGERSQVISVTHSPQIASIASTHLFITKSEVDGRTESSIREIKGEERTAEIARIIGGISITEKQTAAAQEMLNKNINNNN